MARVLPLLLLLCVVPVMGQDAPRVEGTVDVPVRSLEAVVSDAHGERISGLKAADFEVLEGSQPREITNFAESRSEAAQAAPRRVMLVIDNMSLTLANRKLFTSAARDFVQKTLAPTDRLAIVTLTTTATLRFPWSTDRDAATKVIDEIAKEASIGRAEMQRRRAEQDIKSTMTGDAIGASGARGSNVTFDSLTTSVRNYSSVAMNETSQAIVALGESLRFFDRSPGRKLVVLAGEGLPLRPGSDMWEYLESVRMSLDSGATGSTSLQRSARTAMPLNEASQFDISPMLRRIIGAAKAMGVMFYPMNPGTNEKSSGAVEDQDFTNTSADFAKTAGQAGGYKILARDTGGLSFNGSKPALAFDQIARDLQASYSIGYRSGADIDPDTIRLRTKSGQHVRFAIASGALSPEEAVQEIVASNHAGKSAGNDMHITLAADPAVADGAKRRVPLKVMIPVKSLKFDREGGEVVGAFNVYISTGDPKGNASDVTRQSQQLRWPADALPYLAEKNVTFAVDVVLEPGRDQISIGVMDVRSKSTGFEVIRVQ
jgi:VWFA-related protein